MDNVRTIYLDWNTGGIMRSDSGAYLARQYDHLSNLIVFRNAPGLENYYLIVEMKEDEDDLAARSMEPILLPGPYWLVPNVYTQLVQPVTFQVCCKTESGDFEQHSAKFKLNVIESLRHDGAELDVDPSPMYDAYEEYVDEKVQELIDEAGGISIDTRAYVDQKITEMVAAAGEVIIDSTLSISGAAADAKAVGDALSSTNERLDNGLIGAADGFYPILLNATKNSYINKSTGKLEAYSGWMASDFINCDGISTLYIYSPVASIYGAYYSDKNEESYISHLSVDAGDNVKAVPQNAKYIRLSNTNAGLQGTLLQSKDSSKINTLANADNVINAGLKNIGGYVFGEYIDNITGEFVANASYKRTGYIPISDYVDKVIYFTSDYRTPFCCFYNANKEKICSFIIYAGETFVTIPDNAVYCAFSYSRYNALVTMYDPTFTAVKFIGFSNIRDINLKNLERTDILAQMTLKPLFLVYTDLHAYPVNFNRIADFYNSNLKSRVTYPITLGDMVRDQATEDIAWMGTDFGKATLKVIGNHDVLVEGTLPGITSLEAYNKYIAPDVADWGVIQPSNAAVNGYNYYYKDVAYSGGTVRMIILDEYFYDEAQHNWFVATLADANTHGYSIIVCQHQSNVWNNQATPLNDKWAFATPEMGFDLYITNNGYAGVYSGAAENRIMAVNDFIGNGGKFICWMSGHTHSDQCHTFERSNGKQLSLVFSNAGMSMTSSNRFEGYSSDCFQYVAVDLAKKYIYVLRIGTAVDKWFHKNEFMCYDYINHTVVEYC